jgi:hypothetical protein
MCGGLSCGLIGMEEVDRRAPVSPLTPLNDHPATKTLLKLILTGFPEYVLKG